MIVDLLRHASTGRVGHLDGRSDPPLLPGAADALAAHYRTQRWSRIIASPRQRAADTARAFAATHGKTVEIDPCWAEVNFGEWDGLPGAQIDRAALAAFHRDPHRHPAPGGEAWDDFSSRIELGLHGLLSSAGQVPLLVVSHAGALRMALSLACGFPLPALWALRIDYGTRLRLRVEMTQQGKCWGELLEIEQP